MKRTFLLLLTLVTALGASAQFPVGALMIRSDDHEPFYLYLNGQLQNEVPQTDVRIDWMRTKTYQTKIVFENQNLAPITAPVTITGGYNQRERSYAIQRQGRKRVLVFMGAVAYDGGFQAPPGMFVRRINGEVMALGLLPEPVGAPASPLQAQQPQPPVQVNIQINNQPAPPPVYAPDPRVPVPAQVPAPAQVQQGCVNAYPMPGGDFNAALDIIRETSFDDDKLSTAISIAERNCLSTDQIVRICQLFSFDDSRLSFAKAAYHYCTEPYNYFKVNKVFSFSSSKQELNEYIQGR